jgi:hypothetical protein
MGQFAQMTQVAGLATRTAPVRLKKGHMLPAVRQQGVEFLELKCRQRVGIQPLVRVVFGHVTCGGSAFDDCLVSGEKHTSE